MIKFKRFLLTASLCLSLPAVSVADVFSCPSTVTKDFFSAHDRKKLEKLPEGMPTLFMETPFTLGGMNGSDDIHDSDIPVDFHFIEASYNNGSILDYKCLYGSERYKDLSVTLNLSENKLPDSDMPLLIEPYGSSWKTIDEKGQIKRCTKSAEECLFHLPRVGVR